jgi:beta-phosphoglucomutase
MKDKIKAVIFDMDGVLIDAKDWHYESLNRALDLFGLQISRYDHLVTFDGLPTKRKLEMLSLENNFPKGLHQFVNDMKQQFTMEIVTMKCKPVFQHQFALSKLRSEGYKIAVCSNSIRQTIEVMMDKAGLSQFLDFFISNQDVNFGKPNPEMYNLAIARLGMTPNECLIVEDNENGKKAAIASGAHLLAVNDTFDVDYYTISSRIKVIENA